jgi:hypothetical protein
VFGLIVLADNRARYLLQTLRRAFGQSVLFTRVAMACDGSIDEPAGAWQQFAGREGYLPTEHPGDQRAGNTAAAAAKSELAVFSGLNELIDPDYSVVAGNWLARHRGINLLCAEWLTLGASPWYFRKLYYAPESHLGCGRFEHQFYVDNADTCINSVRYPGIWPNRKALQSLIVDAQDRVNTDLNCQKAITVLRDILVTCARAHHYGNEICENHVAT